jgi:hypothetical protein
MLRVRKFSTQGLANGVREGKVGLFGWIHYAKEMKYAKKTQLLYATGNKSESMK